MRASTCEMFHKYTVQYHCLPFSFHSVTRIICSNFAHTHYEIAAIIKPYISVLQLRDRYVSVRVRAPTHRQTLQLTDLKKEDISVLVHRKGAGCRPLLVEHSLANRRG
jgi:hypothetical protein